MLPAEIFPHVVSSMADRYNDINVVILDLGKALERGCFQLEPKVVAVNRLVHNALKVTSRTSVPLHSSNGTLIAAAVFSES